VNRKLKEDLERRLVALKRKKPKLTVRKINRYTVLIEGDSTAFQFLGTLLLSHAQAHDCGDEYSPKGPGWGFFTHDSTLGFYLHRLMRSPMSEAR
jgi:hypothetical protein